MRGARVLLSRVCPSVNCDEVGVRRAQLVDEPGNGDVEFMDVAMPVLIGVTRRRCSFLLKYRRTGGTDWRGLYLLLSLSGYCTFVWATNDVI